MPEDLDLLIELAEATGKPDEVKACREEKRKLPGPRSKRAVKRGGQGQRFPIDEGDRVVVYDPDTLLDVDKALTRLALENPTSAEVARFRLFSGISIDEAGEALAVSRATAFREWAYARSWLTAALAAKRRAQGSP
jgi:predicted DNA-binding protein (UPF0251 family)